jgi:hypothetical protein
LRIALDLINQIMTVFIGLLMIITHEDLLKCVFLLKQIKKNNIKFVQSRSSLPPYIIWKHVLQIVFSPVIPEYVIIKILTIIT